MANSTLVELDLSCISEDDDEFENPDDDLKDHDYDRDPYEDEEDYDEEQSDDDDDGGNKKALSMSLINIWQNKSM